MDRIYETDMMADYFSENELIKKTGVSKSLWEFVLLKEIIDNSLDAIESLQTKKVTVNYFISNGEKHLQIFDNGNGISIDTVKRIYKFSKYVSKNRHHITPSRGKQGNGLKTVISICHLMNYRLIWHTYEGNKIENILDISEIEDGILSCTTKELGYTEFRGIEIVGYDISYSNLISNIEKYVKCNPDVTFSISYTGIYQKEYEATKTPIDKSKNTSISFYDYHSFMRLLREQDGNMTYKQFLGDYFENTRLKNQSTFKCKIKDIDFNSKEFQEDFLQLQSFQKLKQYTILKSHMIGLKYSMNTQVLVEKRNSILNMNTYAPCIVEFDVEKIDFKNDKEYLANCQCFVNNTITYRNSFSFVFDEGYYEIGNRKCKPSQDLADLLYLYNDYKFVFHFISPYFTFKDSGKTEIDISCFISDLCKELKKVLAKEKKKFDLLQEKPIQNTDLLRPYMDEAFNLASTNGKYAITARQMWYKIREISNAPDDAYTSFTQTVLTEWINNHPEYEDKINFANRGVFYIGDKQDGLGTANVRNFINNIGKASNTFNCYGGVSDNVYIDDNFNVEYKYDKVLYIEKTGFDDIFKAEKIGEKYHMIIVSGQGFATRAAKTILYALQNKGLKLYCMHDLDISGVNIFKSFRTTNDKFEYPIDIEDLGITIEDVYRYNIQPERVEKGKTDRDKLLSMSEEYKRFFDGGTYYNRVELNAFSTEQILEIMDRKLSAVNNLPKINLKNTFDVDHVALRDVAFMRVMSRKYKNMLSDIYVPCDLSDYEGKYTVDIAKKAIPEIKDNLILQYEREIEQKLNIS